MTSALPALAVPDGDLAVTEAEDTVDASRLVATWLSSRAESTQRAYLRDLEDVAVTLGLGDPEGLVRRVIRARPAAGADALEAYRHACRTGTRPRAKTKGRLSPAAINRALAAVRSFVRHAARRGVIEWTLTGLVPDEPAESYRDTRGPGLEAVAGMLAVARRQAGLRGARNVALVRLLWDANLRRGEVVGLDVDHIDLAQGRLSVLGKGRRQRRWFTLVPQTAEALSRYLHAPGRPSAGPLFVSLEPDRRTPTGRRLSGGGLYRVTRTLARAAGIQVPVSPHRVRHSTTTHALDQLDGDVRVARGFSRHASVETLLKYDDARRDDYGRVARGQAAALDEAAEAARKGASAGRSEPGPGGEGVGVPNAAPEPLPGHGHDRPEHQDLQPEQGG